MTDSPHEHGVASAGPGPEGAARGIAGADLTTAKVEFVCPRCGQEVAESFYGPCGACREALTARFSADAQRAEPGPARPGDDDERSASSGDTWIDNL